MTAAILAAALAFAPADARLAHQTACGLVRAHTPRDAGTCQGYEAATFIFDAINATGLDASYDRFSVQTPAGRRTMTNIESEYKSDPDAPWVVLVSHYDTKPGIACPGANDGASTTGLLVGIGNALFNQRPRGLNVLLLWTDGEECQVAYGEDDGLWGSRHAAAKLKRSGREILCVICLDMLGDRDLKIGIPRNGSPALRRGIEKIAGEIGLGDCVELRKELMKDDHLPFLTAGFKSAVLIDFAYGPTPDSNEYWHTPQDTIDKISEASLRKAGTLVMAVLDGLHR